MNIKESSQLLKPAWQATAVYGKSGSAVDILTARLYMHPLEFFSPNFLNNTECEIHAPFSGNTVREESENNFSQNENSRASGAHCTQTTRALIIAAWTFRFLGPASVTCYTIMLPLSTGNSLSPTDVRWRDELCPNCWLVIDYFCWPCRPGCDNAIVIALWYCRTAGLQFAALHLVWRVASSLLTHAN